MKPARLIVLAIALVAGGIAAWLASGSRAPEPPKPAPAPPPLATVEVLVAKSDLGVGQVVGEQDVGWQIWPADAANSSFIKKSDRPDAIKDFVGAIVRSAVAAGEPIRDSKVVIAKNGGFMAAVLPRGMRAISLDVAPDTGAGGFILPNDHVDVVLTHRDKVAEKTTGVEKFISETILRNVKVLAIDQTIGEKDGQKVVIGKTATIELDPQQAETLALSRQLGTLSLTLRSILDSQSQTPEGGEGRISLRVMTEVSELSSAFALNISIPNTTQNATVPSIRTRRAETTVEIPSGGALAMAGMIQNDTRQNINGLPGLMELPILGPLFKSRDYINQQTELMVLVTPYVVRAVAQKDLSRPDDGFADASDPATVLLGRLHRIYGIGGLPDPPENQRAKYGFILD